VVKGTQAFLQIGLLLKATIHLHLQCLGDDALTLIEDSLAEFKENIGALAESTDFTSDITDADTQHGAVMDAIDFDDTLNTIITRMSAMAGTEAGNSLMKAIQDAKAQMPAIIDRARSNASTLSSDSIYSTLSHVKSILDNAYANYTQTHDESSTEALDIRSDVEPAIDSLYNLALNTASMGASKLISMAYNAALGMVESSVIDRAVSSYERRARTQHLRGVGRFAGGMADVNAVQSSTFVMGMALLESDFQSDVNAHRSELEVQLYRDAVAAFITVEGQMLGEYLKLYVQEVLIQTDVYKVLRGLRATDLQVFAELVCSLSAEHNKSYETNKLSELDIIKTLSQRESNVFQNGFNGYLDSFVRARLTEETNKARFVLGGADNMGARRHQISTFFRDNVTLVDEIGKTKIVAKSEEYAKNLEYDRMAAMWDVNLFQQAGNILGGVTGAVVPNTDRPSPAQSALSAGLSGAGIGATVGGAPGAAAGFLIGGIGGALANS